jgi:hypothetical protein
MYDTCLFAHRPWEQMAGRRSLVRPQDQRLLFAQTMQPNIITSLSSNPQTRLVCAIIKLRDQKKTSSVRGCATYSLILDSTKVVARPWAHRYLSYSSLSIASLRRYDDCPLEKKQVLTSASTADVLSSFTSMSKIDVAGFGVDISFDWFPRGSSCSFSKRVPEIERAVMELGPADNGSKRPDAVDWKSTRPEKWYGRDPAHDFLSFSIVCS